MMMTSWADMKMGSKPLGPPISTSNCFTGRYSPTYRVPEHSMRRCNTSADAYISGLNNELLSREGLVALDMKHSVSPGPISVTPLPHTPHRESVNLTPGPIPHIKQDMMYPQMSSPGPPPSRQWYQEACLGVSRWTEKQKNVMEVHDMSLDMLGGGGMGGLPTSMGDCVTSPHGIHPSMSMYQLEKNCSALDLFQSHHGGMMGSPHNPLHHPHHPHHVMPMSDMDTDPRELEAFAERFKQRRIKLGVTQCDVGKALANLKLPGVGALSQSTICRFESLTLSHNNMIALKPVLMAWLEEAEAARRDLEINSGLLPPGEKKRKRTSIAAPEKRSLEAYFAVQPRPSGEKIAAIAEKLDLKKNVVRVWFCNQRQKQKRMKFAAQGGPH